jgi:hypothetical protein
MTHDQQVLDARFNSCLPGADKRLIIGVGQPRILNQVLKVAITTAPPGNVRANRFPRRRIDTLSCQSWEGSRQLGDMLERTDCKVAISIIARVSSAFIMRLNRAIDIDTRRTIVLTIRVLGYRLPQYCSSRRSECQWQHQQSRTVWCFSTRWSIIPHPLQGSWH